MCSNTRLINVCLNECMYEFHDVYMTEEKTEYTSNTGTVQKKHFILYIFRSNSDVALEELNWDAHKGESYVVDADNPGKKYRITYFKKCFYGSYGMQHIEMELE